MVHGEHPDNSWTSHNLFGERNNKFDEGNHHQARNGDDHESKSSKSKSSKSKFSKTSYASQSKSKSSKSNHYGKPHIKAVEHSSVFGNEYTPTDSTMGLGEGISGPRLDSVNIDGQYNPTDSTIGLGESVSEQRLDSKSSKSKSSKSKSSNDYPSQSKSKSSGSNHVSKPIEHSSVYGKSSKSKSSKTESKSSTSNHTGRPIEHSSVFGKSSKSKSSKTESKSSKSNYLGKSIEPSYVFGKSSKAKSSKTKSKSSKSNQYVYHNQETKPSPAPVATLTISTFDDGDRATVVAAANSTSKQPSEQPSESASSQPSMHPTDWSSVWSTSEQLAPLRSISSEDSLLTRFYSCSATSEEDLVQDDGNDSLTLTINYELYTTISVDSIANVLATFEGQLAKGVASSMGLLDCSDSSNSDDVNTGIELSVRSGEDGQVMSFNGTRMLQPKRMVSGTRMSPAVVLSDSACTSSATLDTPSQCLPISGALTAWVASFNRRHLQQLAGTDAREEQEAMLCNTVKTYIEKNQASYLNDELLHVAFVGTCNSTVAKDSDSGRSNNVENQVAMDADVKSGQSYIDIIVGTVAAFFAIVVFGVWVHRRRRRQSANQEFTVDAENADNVV